MRARGARNGLRTTIAIQPPQIDGSASARPLPLVEAAMLLMDQERFRPSPGVRASVSDDGLVLLDVEGGLVLSSNTVGARIWQLIEQARTTEEIALQLVVDYAVPVERARRDVRAFVKDLIARGLVAEEATR
jgi:hypothetical protein